MPMRLSQLQEPNQPMRMSQLPQGPVRMSELPAPSSWTTPRTLGGKAIKAIAKPVGRGIKHTVDAVSWPLSRAQYMIATPLHAAVEARRKTKLLQDKPTIGFGTTLPLGTTRGGGEFAETARGTLPALKSLTTWNKPEGAKTYSDILTQYQKMMHGQEVKEYPIPKWLNMHTRFPYSSDPAGRLLSKVAPAVMQGLFPDKSKSIKASTVADIGGTGASFLIDPLVVSKVFKGATAIGKTTPMYKTWLAKQLPKLKEMSLISRAEKGKRIEDITESAKAIGKKPLKALAKQVFGEKLGKPAQNRKELARQMSALRKRYKHIEKGGTGESLPSLDIINRMKETGKELKATGLLGDTFVTKLTRKGRLGKVAEIAKTEKKLKGLSEPPYKKVLTDFVNSLHIRGQESLANKVTTMLSRLDKVDAKTRQKIISDLSKMADVGKGKDAGITKLIKHSLSIRRNTKLLQDAAKSTGQKAIVQKVVNLANRMKDAEPQRHAALAHRMRKMAQEARQYGLEPLKDFVEDVVGIRNSYSGLSRKKAYINKLTALIKDLDTADIKRSQVILKELDKVDEGLGKLGIVGVKPLIKKINAMKRGFPGKAAKTQEYIDKIDDLKAQIKQSDHLGGELYAPRMYREYEEAAKRKWPFFAKNRVRRPYAKKRDLGLPEAVRKAKGEITEIGYPEIKRQIQAASDIETVKHFNKIAQKAEWVSNKVVEGFKQVPEGKAYGNLSGKWVHPTVHKDVTGLVDVRTNAGKILDAVTGTFKGFKVFWSPSTQFRNLGSNTILNHITGTDFAKQVQILPSAIKHIRGNSDEFQYAWKHFARAGFTKGEMLDDLLKMSSGKGSFATKALQFFPKMSAKPAGLYQREEFIGKFVKYLHMRETGMSPIKAVQEANRALFDYSDISNFEKTYLRRAMPFYTFPRKAVPLVLQSMRDNPYNVAMLPMLSEQMTKLSLAKLKMSDEDFNQIADDLPDYMARGSYMLLPYRDENKDIRFMDMTYWAPWGEMAQLANRGPLETVISNPIYTLAADIQRNVNVFTNQPLVMETDTVSEKSAKYFKHFWQMMMPNLTPDIIPSEKWSTGGIYWDKLYDAAMGRKRPATLEFPKGKEVPLAETIGHTIFGARTQAITPQAQTRYSLSNKERQHRELTGKLKKLEMQKMAGRITEAEYQRLKSQYDRQIKNVWGLTEKQTQDDLLLKTAR